VPSPIQTTLRAERLDQLAERLANLVAGELGPSARASGVETWTELARKAGRGRVIVVRGELANNGFSAVADELAGMPRFWERLRKFTPKSRAHAFASRALDAELKSFLPLAPLVVTRIDRSAPLEEPSIALACGDADGDGSPEIVSVGRQRIQLGRIEKGRFVVFQSLAWGALADVAPSPLREPIAAAAVRAPGVLEVGSSDRGSALRLDASLRVVARFPDRLPWPGAGCAAIDAIALGQDPVPCERAPARGAANTPRSPGVDAIAGVRSVRANGAIESVLARRRQQDAFVEVQLGARWIPSAAPAGAQLALGDLDGDGRAELVSSSDTRDPKLDFVRVETLDDQGQLREAFRVPVPSGVQALGICPLEGTGLSPLVLATGDGLWVVR
jgi:hypothetical protein